MNRSSQVTLVIFAWLLTRTWALLSGYQISPYPNSEFLFSDVRLYDWWAGNMADGHFPINDPMWQYPPLAAVVFLSGYLIAGNTVGFVFLAVLADFTIFVLLLRHLKLTKNPSVLPIAIWTATPLIMGPIMLGRFDVFPTLAVVAALLFITSPKAFGSLSALGALLKVWPVLTLLASPPKKFISSAAWFAISFLLGSALLTFWWPNSFSFLTGQKSRGLQIESVGALPFMIWNAGPGTTVTAFQFGAIEVVASHTSIVSFVITVIGLVLLGTVSYWRLSGKLVKASPPDIVLLAVLISMVTSRVLSPQYMVWIFGLLAVASFKPQPKFGQIATLLFISAAIGQLIYPWLYLGFQGGQVITVMAQTIRVATLIWATYLCWGNLKSVTTDPDLDLVRATMR